MRPNLRGWAGRMSPVTEPHPLEFRDDAIRVARNREPGVELSHIAKDFGINFTTLHTWKKAGVEDRRRPSDHNSRDQELPSLFHGS